MKEIENIEDIDKEKLEEAIQKSIEKHGEQIEGYVDYNDLYLEASIAASIIEKGEDHLYELVGDWTIDSPSVYDYQKHIDTVCEILTEDGFDMESIDLDDLENGLKSKLEEKNVGVVYDFSRALDITTVKINITQTSKEEFIEGWQYIKAGNKREEYIPLPAGYDEILKTLGTSETEFKFWFEQNKSAIHSDKAKSNKFMYSIYQEIENCYDGFNQLVFLIQTDLKTALKFKKEKTIRVSKDTSIGFFDSWNGGGSLLEIAPEKDIIIDMTNEYINVIADSQLEYSVENTFGLCGSAWKEYNQPVNEHPNRQKRISKNFS